MLLFEANLKPRVGSKKEEECIRLLQHCQWQHVISINATICVVARCEQRRKEDKEHSKVFTFCSAAANRSVSDGAAQYVCVVTYDKRLAAADDIPN